MHGTKAAKTVFMVLLTPLLLGVLCTSARAVGQESYTRVQDLLGISRMECRSTYTWTRGTNDRAYQFQSEPRITGITPGGPADGNLRPGDQIVAIDGLPITTREAGVHYANLESGKPVELTVRRRGRLITRTIVPRGVLAADSLTASDLSLADAESLLALSKSLEQLARLSARSFHYPFGWFGFELQFNGSIVRKHGVPEWHFRSSPRVDSVQPGSPAHRAGIRRGDVLTRIDGVRLDSGGGGKRFSEVEPGQTVRWTIRRGRVERTVEVTAGQPPSR